MKRTLMLCCMIAAICKPLFAGAEQLLVAQSTPVPPVIDGNGDDPVWLAAAEVVTRDRIADIPITIQAAHTSDTLFLKIVFPDPTENREHKLLEWDPAARIYRTGPKREDIFSIKWNMNPTPVDLSLNSETPYHADVWLWKAFRTDPVGFADDKQHVYGETKFENAKKVITPSGKIMYLSRPADNGKSTYKDKTYSEYAGDEAVRYEHRQPTESRADVEAKGKWTNGFWTIEFKRKLHTGQPDDVQFDTSLPYTFGVSRYEIAGKEPNPSLEQPYYESGDIGDILTLEFR